MHIINLPLHQKPINWNHLLYKINSSVILILVLGVLGDKWYIAVVIKKQSNYKIETIPKIYYQTFKYELVYTHTSIINKYKEDITYEAVLYKFILVANNFLACL